MRSKRRVVMYLFLSIYLLLSLPLAFGEMVTDVGQAPIVDGNIGRARQMAIQDAQRNAVEQGLGTLIDSRTKVVNFQVLEDKIYSRASGYVTRYDILSQGETPDGTVYTVTIRANVQTASIKDDLRAIGILMTQIGNPRFMAMYVPKTRSSAHRNSRVVHAAEEAITGVFARKGFVVLDRMFIDNVYDEIEQAGRIDVDMDELSALALKYKAGLLLVYDVHAAKKVGGRSRYFGGIIVEISLRAVAPATADLIAQKSGDVYVKTMRTGGDYYDSMQAVEAADALGKAVAKALIGDTLAYFERAVHAGTRFVLWFRNFSEDEIYSIVDVIEQMNGFMDKNVRNQSPGDFQLDVNFQGKKFDFQRQLFRGLQEHGIRFKTKQAKGNRFLFFKEGTDNPYRGINIR